MKTEHLKKYLNKLSSREVLERPASAVSPGLEVVRVGGQVHLNASNTNYSFGGLHRVFRKAFQKIEIQKHGFQNVLILGFGAGSVATLLREEFEMPCRITGIEADHEVIRLGREYFRVSRFHDLEVIEADACEYIKLCDQQYDLIVVDVYVDFEVPEECEGREFIDGIARCLSAGGMIVFNKMIYNHEAGRQAAELERKFNDLGGRTRVLKVRESVLNKIIVFEKTR